MPGPKPKVNKILDEIVDLKTVSAFLNLTPGRVRQFSKLGFPQIERGLYPLLKATHWYIQYLRDMAGGRDNKDIEELKRRKLAAEAQLAELKIAEEEKRVVLIEDIARDLERFIISMKQTMTSWPSGLMPQILACTAPEEYQAVLDSAVRALLNDLANGLVNYKRRTKAPKRKAQRSKKAVRARS